MDALQILCTQGAAVLGTFHSLDKGAVTASDQTYHGLRRGAESGRALHGIQHAQTAAGAGPHVDQAAALLQAVGGPLDGGGHLRQHLLHGQHGFFVLPVHGGGDFQRGHLVQVHGGGVALFGSKTGKIYHDLFLLSVQFFSM